MKNPLRRPQRARATKLRRAVALTALAAALAPAASLAASGGIGSPSPDPTATPTSAPFGQRTLRTGMTGSDVRILNGIVASKAYAPSVSLTNLFDGDTAGGVREFQDRKGIPQTGVVNKATAKALTGSMRTAEASYYGEGLYGNGVACGGTLRPNTIGVAHKTLPCGTKVTFGYHGHYIVAKVIDRGPYIDGRTWDLTTAAADALGMTTAGVADVRYAVDR